MSDINTTQRTSSSASADNTAVHSATMQERSISRIALISELVVFGVMLLIAVTVASDIHVMTIIMSMLVLIAVAGCAYVLRTWPFGYRDETTNFARALAGVAMMISVIELERTGMLGEYTTSTDVDIFSKRLISHWAITIVLLLVIVLVVAFARQMAREPRSHLIVSLSVSLMATIVTLGGASWAFLPLLVAQSMHHTYGAALFIAYLGVLIIALVVTAIRMPNRKDQYGIDTKNSVITKQSMSGQDDIHSEMLQYGSTALPPHASLKKIRRRGIGRGIAMAMMAGYGAYVIAATIMILHSM